MSNNTKPLPFYKDLLYYTALIAVVGMVLTAYSIIENNASSNLMIPSIFLVSIFGVMTYYMWYTRCPHCKRPFVKTEVEKELVETKNENSLLKEELIALQEQMKEIFSQVTKLSNNSSISLMSK